MNGAKQSPVQAPTTSAEGDTSKFNRLAWMIIIVSSAIVAAIFTYYLLVPVDESAIDFNVNEFQRAREGKGADSATNIEKDLGGIDLEGLDTELNDIDNAL